MTQTPERPPRRRILSPATAFHMGRLVAAGCALPNAPQLSRPVNTVDFNNPDTPAMVRRAVTSMETTMRNLQLIPGMNFGGMNHAQLRLAMGEPALDIVAIPAEARGQTDVRNVAGVLFRILVNVAFDPAPENKANIPLMEGCYSSGPVVVLSRMSREVPNLRAFTPDGEPVHEEVVTGLTALSVQHERKHSLGVRAADPIPAHELQEGASRRLLWVPREDVHAFRELGRDRAHEWRMDCPPEQWQEFSRDPNYNYFPTAELQEAFAAGQQAQLLAQAQ